MTKTRKISSVTTAALGDDEARSLRKLSNALFRGWLLVLIVVVLAGIGIVAVLVGAALGGVPLPGVVVIGSFLGFMCLVAVSESRRQFARVRSVEQALESGTKRIVLTSLTGVRTTGSLKTTRTYIALENEGEFELHFFMPRRQGARGFDGLIFPVPVEAQLTERGALVLSVDLLEYSLDAIRARTALR